METGFIYICDIMIRDQTNIILVWSDDMMQYILRCNAEGENNQQNSGKKTSYDLIFIQLLFATRLQISDFLNTRSWVVSFK